MEFPNMRRFRQQLSQEECEVALARGTSGVLAVTGTGGWPYAVPLSYTYKEGKLLFHCAKEGHKLDALKADPRASFCVIDQDRIVPGEFTTYYRSVIAFGTVRVLETPAKLEAATRALTAKYCPHETPEAVDREIGGAMTRLRALEMTVEHITGKQARELAAKMPETQKGSP